MEGSMRRSWYSLDGQLPPSLKAIVKAFQKEAKHGVLLGKTVGGLWALIQGSDSYYDKDPAKPRDVFDFLCGAGMILEDRQTRMFFLDPEVADKLAQRASDGRVTIPKF